jgi:hypothetical protein
VHVIADLVPNAEYLIARNGSSIATALASSQGVLTFRSSGGGLFMVRDQRAAPKVQARRRSVARRITAAQKSRSVHGARFIDATIRRPAPTNRSVSSVPSHIGLISPDAGGPA